MNCKIIKRLAALSAAAFLILTGCSKKEVPLHIVDETVAMPGISRTYDILFVTDSHCVVAEGGESEEIDNYAEERYGGFVSPDGTDSKTMFEAMIDYAVKEKVDAFLLGGDIIDCPSEANLNFLGNQLKKMDGQYLYTPGNHDWTYPWEYMTETGYDEYLPKLEPFMHNNTEFQVMELGELQIVAVNNSTSQISPGMLMRYKQVLEQKKPVILIVHMPFLSQSVLTKAREAWSSPTVIGGGNYGGIYPNEITQEFMNLTTAEDSPVQLILAGHVHFYDKDTMDGTRPVLQIVGEAGYLGSAVRLKIVPEGTE